MLFRQGLIINSLIDLSLIFIFALAMLYLLRKVAKHPSIALLDKPNDRKFHKDDVPLVGGLSICLSIVYFLYNTQIFFEYSTLYTIAIVLLVALGVLDDKYDVSFKLRLGLQIGLALCVVQLTTLELDDLGNLFGFGELHLPSVIAMIVTVFVVLGSINAFNMVDGIDGLLGALASVTFAGLSILFYFYGFGDYSYFCIVIIVAMLPYILFNLGFFGRTRKVFMGDAGSMLIGFTVAVLLLLGTQSTVTGGTFSVVTALWLVAIPLVDMAAIIYRRIRRGDSPFRPDREHLHHIFQRIGFTSKQTLMMICGLSSLCAVIGILGEIYQAPESLMFYSFILFFVLYTLSIIKIENRRN